MGVHDIWSTSWKTKALSRLPKAQQLVVRCIPHICHFFTQAKFLENEIYTEKRVNYDKLHSKLPILRVNYDKTHSKLPFFRVTSEKIYTGQKNLHGRRPWRPWQIWGMVRWLDWKGQGVNSQKSLIVKSKKRKTDLADIMLTNHHHSWLYSMIVGSMVNYICLDRNVPQERLSNTMMNGNVRKWWWQRVICFLC